MKEIQLKNLNTKFLGQKAIFYENIDSTQSEIWRRIENKNIQNGNIIIAEMQSNGMRNAR